MKAYEYILSRQIHWALNRNIKLIDSKNERGRSAYVSKLEDNLFEPLLGSTREAFEKGAGNELHGDSGSPPKMSAVHSSSALAVNIFQYWEKIKQVSSIAAACGLCAKSNNMPVSISFEREYPISGSFNIPPHVDVVIKNREGAQYKVFAIECKFSEAYATQRHGGIKQKYINSQEIWHDIPKLYELAKAICPDDNFNNHLHAAQLIKHILGLKNCYGKKSFRLLYLWYDVYGEEGFKHRNEIGQFKEIAEKDGIKFHSLSYQELILNLSTEYRNSHQNYISYVADRYL